MRSYLCQVTFVVDEDYNDTMWCDVVLMDTEDVLIGRLWIYHQNGIHGIRTIPVHLFMKKKKLSRYNCHAIYYEAGTAK